MKETKISEDIIKMVEDKMGGYPSLIQSGPYSEDVVNDLQLKNEVIWSNQYLNEKYGYVLHEGLIEFSEGSSYIYVKKVDTEPYYWFVFMVNKMGRDQTMFLIQKIKDKRKQSYF
jgi:hypothetical protein